jgi:cell division protein ZipA
MEWLRWIVLLVGLLVIGGIVWMYRRHRSEQAVDLGGGHSAGGDYHDPIDASVGVRMEEDVEDLERALDAGETRREPRLDVDEASDAERGEPEEFVDGVSRARVVSRSSSAPVGPETPPGEDEPAARPQPGYSSLFTREGQVADAASPSGPAADDEPSFDEPVDSPPGGTKAAAKSHEAVISMIVVDRGQQPMPAERVRRGIEEVGFEFGDFDIFHFHDRDGQRWFSLMNAVSPGRFHPDDLSSFETPALALFMQLPTEGADPSLVLDRMHQVATSLADSLDAMLVDDRREPLDTESIDRYREIIETYR